MKELLTKKYAGLPGWAWLAIGVAGIGAGILLIRWQQSKKAATPASLTASTSPDLTTGNAAGNESNPETGAVGSNGVINNPFPEAQVGGGLVPVLPPGYQYIYDSQGNPVGIEPIPPTTTPPTTTPPATTPPAPQTYTLTQSFIDQHHHKGVLHAVAAMFGITYDQLYQANKSQLGNDPNHANYKANMVLTIPMATTGLQPLTVSRTRAA